MGNGRILHKTSTPLPFNIDQPNDTPFDKTHRDGQYLKAKYFLLDKFLAWSCTLQNYTVEFSKTRLTYFISNPSLCNFQENSVTINTFINLTVRPLLCVSDGTSITWQNSKYWQTCLPYFQ
jgi:hypothetical protein